MAAQLVASGVVLGSTELVSFKNERTEFRTLKFPNAL
jgi:hypothetical protein